jgi:hypothetical protein
MSGMNVLIMYDYAHACFIFAYFKLARPFSGLAEQIQVEKAGWE